MYEGTTREDNVKFVFPIDGDCVNCHDGKVDERGGVCLEAVVQAPVSSDIYINGRKASFSDGFYRGEVAVSGYRNTLTVEDRTHGESSTIAVYHMPRTVGRYRLSSDDNILFLQDITNNKDTYTSIFDNPYLALYKKAHDRYDARVHLNLFYEFRPEEAHFSDPGRGYFNLSMMTDKFRDEFRANADWLKLAFHAQSEYPDRPYQRASAQVVTADCLRVCKEIIRFAGAECINDTTTVHWGEASREGVRALRALGFRSLTGYFERLGDGTPLVAYYTDGELLDHIGGRDFWVDTKEDMLFGRIDLVLNGGTYTYVQDTLREIVANPHRSGFVSIMIHEQYFYEDYANYLADYEKRVLDSCRFLFEQGYCGAHICDVTGEEHVRDVVAAFFGKQG